MRESEVDTAAASIEIDGRRFASATTSCCGRSPARSPARFRSSTSATAGRCPASSVDPFAGVDVKGKIVVAHGPRALPKGVDIPLIGRVNVGASDGVRRGRTPRRRGGDLHRPGLALTGWARGADPEHDRARAGSQSCRPPMRRCRSLAVMVTPQVDGRFDGGRARRRGGARRRVPRQQDYPRIVPADEVRSTLNVPAKRRPTIGPTTWSR